MPDLSLAATPPAGRAAPSAATVGGLFLGFLGIGLMGFGGVLPLARRMVVERRGWLTAAEFTDLLGLCQFLPGGNVINLSVAVGLRHRGLAGALAALVGLIAVPSAIAIGLGALYAHAQGAPAIGRLFAGLAAAAAGLLVAMAARMAAPLARLPRAAAVAALVVVAIAGLRLPLPLVLLAAMPVGVVATGGRP